MTGQAAGLAQREAKSVISGHASSDVGALPAVVGEREQERHRVHQVRREPLEEQRPLAERLTHQPDVQLLEVAQPAVDELARSRRGAGAKVPGLDEPYGQPSGDRVERDSGAHDAAADDQHLQLRAGQRVKRGRALGRAEPRGRPRRAAASRLAVAGLLAASAAAGPDPDVSAASHWGSPRPPPAGTP